MDHEVVPTSEQKPVKHPKRGRYEPVVLAEEDGNDDDEHENKISGEEGREA